MTLVEVIKNILWFFIQPLLLLWSWLSSLYWSSSVDLSQTFVVAGITICVAWAIVVGAAIQYIVYTQHRSQSHQRVINPFLSSGEQERMEAPLEQHFHQEDLPLLTEMICQVLIAIDADSNHKADASSVRAILRYNQSAYTQLLHQLHQTDHSLPLHMCKVLVVVFMAEWIIGLKLTENRHSLGELGKYVNCPSIEAMTNEIGIFCRRNTIVISADTRQILATAIVASIDRFLKRKVNPRRLREMLMSCFPGKTHLENLLFDLSVSHYSVLGEQHDTYHMRVAEYFMKEGREEELISYARGHCRSGAAWNDIYD